MDINVTRSSLPDIEEYIEEIRPIFENHMLTNMGPVYKKFQHMLIDYLGVPFLSLFVNGHMALELAVQAMNLNREFGEVITTPFTFVSTTHAIVRNGLNPVFCDIKAEDYTIDPEKIEALITDKTVAIMPVHVYGNVCDIDAIDSIARKHGIKVIYDGAHAFAEKYRGVGIGNFGDATMFSFHATKVFNSIEGGAIAFRDEKYRKPLHEIKNFGIFNSEIVDSVGVNAKLDEFRAAMGICNLRRVEECMMKRKKVYDRYNERLKDVPGIRFCKRNPETTYNYAYYPLVFDREVFGRSRDDVYHQLLAHHVHTRKYFYPATNELAVYKNVYNSTNTPIAHDISLNILTLPIYEELSLDDVDMICDVILNKA